MLGSLARKLRALGFDVSYYREGDDMGLIRQASSERRVILTADRSLGERAASAGVAAIGVTGGTDAQRIRSVATGAGELRLTLVRGEPLCSLCGGELEELGRDGARGLVPPSVLSRHRAFFRCQECGKLYWKGTHWKKLRSLSRLLRETHVSRG